MHKTELDNLEVWIRKDMENNEHVDGVFNDGYIHAMYMVLKQIKKMHKEVSAS